jgi:hypothetical protein
MAIDESVLQTRAEANRRTINNMVGAVAQLLSQVNKRGDGAEPSGANRVHDLRANSGHLQFFRATIRS